MPHRTPQASAHQQAVLEELSNLVHGISAPFVCSGTLVPEAPVTLRFKDGVQVPITRLERGTAPHTALEPLLARCSSAPFGIVRARVAIYGEDDDKWGPTSVYALCDVQDGNYVLVDVARQENGRYPLFDGDHEAWPDPAYCKQVASSFSEFLEQVLRTRRRLYCLGS